MRGDHEHAWRLFDESLAIHRSLDDAMGVSHSLVNLSLLALEAGDVRDGAHAALARASRSSATATTSRSSRTCSRCRRGSRPRTARPALAIRLYARAGLLRERVGRRLQFDLGWPDPAPSLGDLRSRVGEETFEEECERGRAMTVLEAIDQASGAAASAAARRSA